MKQEKNQTALPDIQPWQWQTLSRLSRGVKKGEAIIISSSRSTGKSRMAAMYLEQQMNFSSSWTAWEETFVWPWDKQESINGKRIWGKMKTRVHKFAIMDGDEYRQYATDKCIFEGKLKGTL